jgi:hypothetical protein
MPDFSKWTIVEDDKLKSKPDFSRWSVVGDEAVSTDGAAITMPGTELAPEHGAGGNATQAIGDLLRVVNQGITLGLWDDIEAGIRALRAGKPWSEIAPETHRQAREAEERMGPVFGTAAKIAGGLAAGAPVAQTARAFIGQTPSMLRTMGGTFMSTWPLSTLTSFGEQAPDEKSAGRAITEGAAGAATATALIPGMAAAGWGWRVGPREIYGRIGEYVRSRPGNPDRYTPLPFTMEKAVGKIADAAEQGGTNTAIMLANAMARAQVPGTPMALVNAGNDRLLALGREAARTTKNPNVPRIVGGRPTQTNVFDALAADQDRVMLPGRTTPVSQSEAFRTRLFEEHGIPTSASQGPRALNERLNARLENASATIAGLTAGGNTRVPGFVNLIDQSPDAARIYQKAANALSIPGARGYIPREQIPLPPAEYQRAFRNWDARRQAAANAGRPFNDPPPVQLTDRNIPTQLLADFMSEASSMSTAEDGIARSAGVRIFGAVQDLARGTPARSRGYRLQSARADMGQTHTQREDVNLGRRLMDQEPSVQDQTLADRTTLPPNRQADQRRGYFYGVDDRLNDASNDFGRLQQTFLRTERDRDIFERVARPGAPGPTRSSTLVRNELDNVAEMQRISSDLQRLSESRNIQNKTFAETAAQAGSWMGFKRGAALALVIRDLGVGTSQAQRQQIARLLTDTSGEGQRLLAQELARRNINLRRLTPLGQALVLQEIGRQIGGGLENIVN